MRLLIGPTCAGKTTLLRKWQEDASADGSRLNFHHAYEVKETSHIPTGPDEVVHYNLLGVHRATPGGRRRRRRSIAMGSPLLASLIDAADEVVVLTAPVGKLLERDAMRRQGRLESGLEYPTEWRDQLASRGLCQLYEKLALHLDASGTPHRYLCSNGDVHEGYQSLPRWEFPRLAVKGSQKLCLRGHDTELPELQGRSYQADYQPDGRVRTRAASLALALQMPLAGKRLLDIGCAEGAAAMSAERMGARVVGIEPRAARIERARTVSAALGSRVDWRNIGLTELRDPADSYDVVLALNVIHHVPDAWEFLDRAAELTSSHLVLEYPGLNDRKFRATVDVDGELDESMPLIGVSTRAKGQTFVYTPSALERYLIGTVGLFRRHEVVHSPMDNRWLSIFSGKRQAPPKLPSPEELELRRRSEEQARTIARQRETIRNLRASRSWRVTAPLRAIRGRDLVGRRRSH